MPLRPGDQLERDITPTPRKKKGDTSWIHEEIIKSFASSSAIEREFEKAGVPPKIVHAVVKEIQTHEASTIWDRLPALAEKLWLPEIPLRKIVRVLLVVLTLAGSGKIIVDTYRSQTSPKLEAVARPIQLDSLAGHGQTKLSWFLGAMLDASNEDIFDRKALINLSDTTHREVDYHENLTKLWEHKFANNPDSKNMAAMTGVYEKTIVPMVENNMPFTKYSLQEWRTDMQATIDEVNMHIDRKIVCEKLWVDYAYSDVLQKVFMRMRNEHVLSYLCTELFGDLPGTFSLHYLDFLFQNAGKEYVYHIPAVYDDMASFGPYQLTSAVVRHDRKKWSANVIQEALPENYRTIPGSMYKLTPEQQNQATYLNMIYNMWLLINILEKNKMSSNEIQKLGEIDMQTLLEYLAVSHNSPRTAVRAMLHWLKKDMKKPFDSYIGKKKIYAERTTKFYNAVQKQFPPQE